MESTPYESAPVRSSRRPHHHLFSVSLGDRIAASVTPTRHCKVYRISQALNEDDLGALDRWLTPDSGATNSAIARALTAEGHPVSDQVIRLHRYGLCVCKGTSA